MRNRREFGKLLLAGTPGAIAAAAKISSTVKGVRLGVCTYSFRDLPRTPGQDNVDALIQALRDTGAGETEPFAPNVEPAGTMSSGCPGGPGVPGAPPKAAGPPSADAEASMRARMNSPEAKQAREDLREWRLSTSMEHFHAIRTRFDASVNDPNEFSTPETFQKALDASNISW